MKSVDFLYPGKKLLRKSTGEYWFMMETDDHMVDLIRPVTAISVSDFASCIVTPSGDRIYKLGGITQREAVERCYQAISQVSMIPTDELFDPWKVPKTGVYFTGSYIYEIDYNAEFDINIKRALHIDFPAWTLVVDKDFDPYTHTQPIGPQDLRLVRFRETDVFPEETDRVAMDSYEQVVIFHYQQVDEDSLKEYYTPCAEFE